MKIRLHALTATMALAGVFGALPLSANALGFGAIRVQSEIGQPLRAEVELRLGAGESSDELAVRHAGATEYERQGVNYTAVLSSMSVAIQTRAGKSVAIVTTRAPVNEPMVQFILQTESTQGRMYRSFSLPLSTTAIAGTSAGQSASASFAITAMDAFGKAPSSFDEAGNVYRDEATKLYDRVIEIGTRPSGNLLARVKGAGKNDSTSQVLPKVVPKGWKGYAGDDGVRHAKSIAWVGANRFWVTVLDEVMAASGLTATVNWDRKEVTFRGLVAMTNEAVATAAPSAASTTATTAAVAAGPALPKFKATEVSAAQRAAAVRSEHAAASALRSQAEEARVAQSKADAAQTARAAQATQASQAQEAQQLIEARAATERAQAEAQRAEAEVQRAQVAAQEAQALTERQTAEARVAQEALMAQRVEQEKQIDFDRQARQAQLDREATQARETADAANFKAAAATSAAADAATAKAAAEATEQRRVVEAAEAAVRAIPVAAAPVNLKVVKLMGEGQPQFYEVRSSGFNVTLYSAVQRILPPGWSLFTQNASLSAVENVAWRGASRHWLSVLDETLGPLGVQAIVNVRRKEVFLIRK